MPQLPHDVKIVTKNNRLQRLEIDGAEFPWMLSSDEGVDLDIPGEGLVRLSVTLLVDQDCLQIRSES